MAARTYGLYCYKFIEAMNGDIYRIQFHRENYTGEAFEIDKMGVTPFTINIDGQGEALTRPIVKSSLSIQIIDTEQFDYSIFYTASAFEWKIDVACVNAGQRFVWGGYLTPDSFQQACVKGATISLTARDNLGYLDEVDFDKVSYNYSDDHGDGIAAVEDVIRTAIDVIGLGYLMVIDFKVKTAGEIGGSYTDLLSLCVNTRLFEGKTWGDALRMVLSSFGWQIRPSFVEDRLPPGTISSVPMRYEIIDVAKLGNPESWNGTVEPMFLMNSKQMAIQPNWRELKIEQDYGVIENFFPMPTEEDYKTAYRGIQFKSYRRFGIWVNANQLDEYEPAQWTIPYCANLKATQDRSLYALNGAVYNNGAFSNSLILTNLTPEYTNTRKKISYAFYMDSVNGAAFRANLRLHEQLYTLRNTDPYDGSSELNPSLNANLALIPKDIKGGLVKCTLKFDIVVYPDGADPIVCTPSGWEPYDETADPNIVFTFESKFWGKYSQYTNLQGQQTLVNDITFAEGAAEMPMVEFSITANNVPNGQMVMMFYRPEYENTIPTPTWESDLVAFVFDNITASFDISTPKGQTLVIANDASANIKESTTTSIGTCPANCGGALAFAGGVYGRTEWRTLVRGFRRDENDANPSALSVLTAKALMHHRRKTRNVYTGTIRYTLPYFESLLMIDGKTCAINAASYDILRNRMSGEYIEVEPYTDPAIELNDRVVSSGGSTIGSGTTSTTTTIIKVGGQAVETQRVYSLESVPASSALSQYVMVDSDGQRTAKKVRLSEVLATATTHNKGYYATVADLQSAFPTAPVGSIAYVGTSYPFALYRYTDGAWVDSGEIGGDEQVDLSGLVSKEELQLAIKESAVVETNTSKRGDFEIADERGRVLVRFADGHIETRNFDSRKANAVSTDEGKRGDFEIADERGRVLVRFIDGHIVTKNFDSRDSAAPNIGVIFE